MFYGGKKLFHFDTALPKINIFDLITGMGAYLRHTTPKHYTGRMRSFAQKTGLRLKDNNIPDIQVYYEDSFDAQKGDSSPEPGIDRVVIYKRGSGDESPKYELTFSTTQHTGSINSFGGTKKDREPTTGSHKGFRSDMLADLHKSCSLFRDFSNGDKWLTHQELTGIAMSLIHVDGGKTFF